MPAGFWDEPKNRRRYMQWLGKQLDYRRPEDWYHIGKEDFNKNHGSGLLKKFPSFWDLVCEYLPRFDWDGRLDVAKILKWADAYFKEHGRWPSEDSGPILGSKATWSSINACLALGHRGLPGGCTLAQLLQKHRDVPRWSHRPKLTETQILQWADAYHAKHGKWPSQLSGEIPGTGEAWRRIDCALSRGARGLPGDTTLSKLIQRRKVNQ